MKYSHGCEDNAVGRCILYMIYSYVFKKINKKIENVVRKLKTIKNNKTEILELKNTVNYIRNSVEGLVVA